MKISLLIVALLLTFGAVQKADIKLEVGSVLPAKYVPKKNHNLYMTHSSQFRPFIKREVAGVNYVIAYEEKSRAIKYIYTKDKRFRTADGLQVGSYIEVNNEQISAYPGWEIRAPEDKEGWQPLIGFNNEMTVLDGEKDIRIELKQYRIESEQPVKAKIIAFVKGSN